MVDTRFSLSVHVMMTLGHSKELVNSEYIAGTLKTNPTFIRKIVARLVEAGLVESYRGKGGGIKIARAPTEITLKDIYCAAVEEKCLLSTHKKPTIKSCPVSCSMEGILEDIVDGIENTTKSYLTKTHLSDLLKKVKR